MKNVSTKAQSADFIKNGHIFGQEINKAMCSTRFSVDFDSYAFKNHFCQAKIVSIFFSTQYFFCKGALIICFKWPEALVPEGNGPANYKAEHVQATADDAQVSLTHT